MHLCYSSSPFGECMRSTQCLAVLCVCANDNDSGYWIGSNGKVNTIFGNRVDCTKLQTAPECIWHISKAGTKCRRNQCFNRIGSDSVQAQNECNARQWHGAKLIYFRLNVIKKSRQKISRFHSMRTAACQMNPENLHFICRTNKIRCSIHRNLN